MTHAPCADCVFRRPRVSVTGLLASLDLPLVDTLAQTVAELEGWLEEQRNQELATLQRVADDRITADWPRRPKAHDHCGLEAMRPRVLELANPSGGCRSHVRATPLHRPCASCRWLQRPPQAMNEVWRRAGGGQAALRFAQSAAGVTETLARNELMDAVKRGGVVPEAPRFLPVCGRVGGPGRAVIGPIVNWMGACGAWSPVVPSAERNS